MKWSSDSVIDYIWYSTNNGSSWTGINVADGTSGTYTISGLSANSTYQIKTRVRRKDSQKTTDSSALSVTTYAYPYCNSMPNFTIGSKLTLGFYNPLGRSITVNILGADNSQISNDTTSGTSISGYNNSTIQSRLYASIPNAKSGTYKVKTTYGGQSNTKTGGTYTINENVCKPSITSVAYKDTNATTTAITDNDQLIIQNQSKVQVTSVLAPNYSATVASCKVVINGVTTNMAVSGNNASVGNLNINSASNLTATVTMTDSRGLTASKSVTIQMLEWSLPTAEIDLQREDNYYTNTNITVDATYSSLNGENTIAIKTRYKKTTDSTWSAYVDLQDNVTSTLALDNNYEWNVQIVLTDEFGTTTYNATVSRGMPIMYYDTLKSSVGINCFPQNEQSLEVDGFDMFAHDGDSVAINDAVVGGRLSNSKKELRFSVPLPQYAVGLTPTITTLKLNVRTADGGYLLSSGYVAGGYNVLTDGNLTVTCWLASANLLTVEVDATTAWSGPTNNTPQAVDVMDMAVEFSAS